MPASVLRQLLLRAIGNLHQRTSESMVVLRYQIGNQGERVKENDHQTTRIER